MRDRDPEGAARRVEVGVYFAAALSYIIAGYFTRSFVLNWIVGPVWFVAWVTLVTPLVLRAMGLDDPDGRGVPIPDPASFSADPAPASTPATNEEPTT